MTDIHCDAIKIAYRQSKDGFVVSFAVHPQDMPAVLANADIGSQWRLVLSELDEHGNSSVAGEAPGPSTFAANLNTSASVSRRGEPASTRKSWHEMTPAQQAGILCADKSFQKYMGWDNESDTVADVKAICGITSRTQITPGSAAVIEWRGIVSKYRTWQLAAQVIP